MLKLSDKQHVIGVEGMEKETKTTVEKLSQNFLDVTYEVVPYREFANREAKVVLKESVRERYPHYLSDIALMKHTDSSPKFNDLLMRDMLIRQCAINHGAK